MCLHFSSFPLRVCLNGGERTRSGAIYTGISAGYKEIRPYIIVCLRRQTDVIEIMGNCEENGREYAAVAAAATISARAPGGLFNSIKRKRCDSSNALYSYTLSTMTVKESSAIGSFLGNLYP